MGRMALWPRGQKKTFPTRGKCFLPAARPGKNFPAAGNSFSHGGSARITGYLVETLNLGLSCVLAAIAAILAALDRFASSARNRFAVRLISAAPQATSLSGGACSRRRLRYRRMRSSICSVTRLRYEIPSGEADSSMAIAACAAAHRSSDARSSAICQAKRSSTASRAAVAAASAACSWAFARRRYQVCCGICPWPARGALRACAGLSHALGASGGSGDGRARVAPVQLGRV
jgi:hypothetical protein